jgi:hypothetical protein
MAEEDRSEAVDLHRRRRREPLEPTSVGGPQPGSRPAADLVVAELDRFAAGQRGELPVCIAAEQDDRG